MKRAEEKAKKAEAERVAREKAEAEEKAKKAEEEKKASEEKALWDVLNNVLDKNTRGKKPGGRRKVDHFLPLAKKLLSMDNTTLNELTLDKARNIDDLKAYIHQANLDGMMFKDTKTKVFENLRKKLLGLKKGGNWTPELHQASADTK